MAFLGYEVNGVIQQEPPEGLLDRIEAAVIEVLGLVQE